MKKIVNAVFKKIDKLKELKEKRQKEDENKLPTLLIAEEDPTIPHKVELDIPFKVLLKIMFAIALFMAGREIFNELSSILTTVAIAAFLAMGLTPVVSTLERFMPRPVAILVLYLGFIGVIGVLFVQIIPIISEQLFDISVDIRQFLKDSPTIEIPYLSNYIGTFELDTAELSDLLATDLSNLSNNLGQVAGSTFSLVTGVFEGIFNFFFALVILFFMLMEREQLGHSLLVMFAPNEQKYIQHKASSIQNKMGKWFKGQIILMLSIGISMYLGMLVFEYFFGMKYAATIGLLAGVMELFPYVGVFVTYLVAGLVAANISWVLFVLVIGWIALTQFLEGNLLVPLVMEKVVGLPSVVVILALAIGGILGSAVGGVTMAILGMILSIPVAASIAIFTDEYAHRGDKKTKEKDKE